MEDQNVTPPRFTDSGASPAPQRHSIKNRASMRRSKKFLMICGVLIFAGLAAVGSLKLFKKRPATRHIPPQTATQSTPSTVKLPSDVPDAPNQTPYSSSLLSLKLTYPSTWKLTETPDNGVKLESPAFAYDTLLGAVNGYFRLYIRKGARSVDSNYIGRGVAIDASQKLTYTQPAPSQRKDTLVSLFGIDDSDSFSYLFVAGNFQLKKGDTLGPGYGKEADTFIIAGGYTDDSLKDDLATNAVSPTLLTTSKAYKQALEIIQTLQLY